MQKKKRTGTTINKTKQIWANKKRIKMQHKTHSLHIKKQQ